MELVVYRQCDYNEIDSMVHTHLGIRKYEFLAAEEARNGTYYTFNVDGKFDKYDIASLEEMKTSARPFWNTRVLLNELCRIGILDEGKYLVEASW